MAQILDSITVGEYCLLELDTDPRTAGGTPATLGSIAVVQPNGSDLPQIFQKTGNSDTEWVQYDSNTRTVTKPAHGFTLTDNIPLPAYFDSGTGLTLSQADDADTLKAVFITKIIDANTVEIKHSGIHFAPSHGLTQGSYYFLSQTVAGDSTSFNFITGINDPVFFVIDSDTLLLLDNRAIDQDSFNDYQSFLTGIHRDNRQRQINLS